MRNLLLTSNGISNEILKNHLISILPKEIKKCSLAIIVNSTYDISEKIRKAEKRKLRAQNNGFVMIDIIDLEKQDPKILRGYDCIEIAGGNPFILLNILNICLAKKELFELVKHGKIIIGESAGSMILTPNLNFINYVDGQLNDEVKLKDLKALNLFPYEIFPHYDTYCEINKDLKVAFKNYEREFNISLIKLEDGKLVYEDNGILKII